MQTASQPTSNAPVRDAEESAGQDRQAASPVIEGKGDDIFTDSEGEEGSKSGSRRSARKIAASEDLAGSEPEPRESDDGASTKFGAFSHAFLSMRTAMDRVGVTSGTWAGGRSMSAAQSELVTSADAECLPEDVDKSNEVDKSEQTVESVEHSSQQSRGAFGDSVTSGGEQSRVKASLPDVMAGNAAGVDEQGQEAKYAGPSRLEQHETHDNGGGESAASSDFQAVAAANAADASFFTFGDEEDYESEEEL